MDVKQRAFNMDDWADEAESLWSTRILDQSQDVCLLE